MLRLTTVAPKVAVTVIVPEPDGTSSQNVCDRVPAMPPTLESCVLIGARVPPRPSVTVMEVLAAMLTNATMSSPALTPDALVAAIVVSPLSAVPLKVWTNATQDHSSHSNEHVYRCDAGS